MAMSSSFFFSTVSEQVVFQAARSATSRWAESKYRTDTLHRWLQFPFDVAVYNTGIR